MSDLPFHYISAILDSAHRELYHLCLNITFPSPPTQKLVMSKKYAKNNRKVNIFLSHKMTHDLFNLLGISLWLLVPVQEVPYLGGL